MHWPLACSHVPRVAAPYIGVDMNRSLHDNALFRAADIQRADLLLKRVLMFAGAVVVGIAAYAIVGLLAGA